MYSKSGKNDVQGYFQNDAAIHLAHDFTESGFVFAPFHGTQYILIPAQQSEKWQAKYLPTTGFAEIPIFENNAFGKSAFENLVRKGVAAIKNDEFGKVVLSRKEILAIDSDAITLFEKLLHTYPTAYCYCWFHPQIGLWLGATPERLLRAENSKFHTMALAGTQQFQGSEVVEWQDKEKVEQQFVTDFIVGHLENKVSDYRVSKPYTARAGNLLHLKTDIEGVLKDGFTLKEIVAILHPTPAVCGFPKASSQKFILENEGYDREYYSGFLGELNLIGENGFLETDLYVNLRCMQWKAQQAHLYVGCGITKDSDPEKEYIETVNKSLTIKKILWQN